MNWLRRHSYLMAAVFACGLSATMLHASCQSDECTNVVFYGPAANDWCKDYESGQAQILRSSAPMGGTREPYLDAQGLPIKVGFLVYPACAQNCDCTIPPVYSLKRCHGAVGTGTKGPGENWYYCCVGTCT